MAMIQGRCAKCRQCKALHVLSSGLRVCVACLRKLMDEGLKAEIRK